MTRLAVLLSGNGTTLQNLLDHIRAGTLPAEVVRVIGSNPQAYGLTRAQLAGIPTAYVRRKACASAEEFGERIFALVRDSRADLVCMAGFLQLLPIPDDFKNRVLNIHPALIPAFSGKGFHGLHVHRSALEAGVKVSGCTVHFADNLYDHGPIIVQKTVPVLENDTPQTLASRVFYAECEAFPEAIRLFASGRLVVTESRCRILDSDGSNR